MEEKEKNLRDEKVPIVRRVTTQQPALISTADSVVIEDDTTMRETNSQNRDRNERRRVRHAFFLSLQFGTSSIIMKCGKLRTRMAEDKW